MIPKICHQNALRGRLIQTSDCILWTKLKTKPFYYLDVFVFSHSLFVTFLIIFREKKRNIWNRKMIDERRVPMFAEKMICLNFAERNTTTYNNERFSMKWTNVTIYLWLLVSWCTSGLTGSKQTADRNDMYRKSVYYLRLLIFIKSSLYFGGCLFDLRNNKETKIKDTSEKKVD